MCLPFPDPFNEFISSRRRWRPSSEFRSTHSAAIPRGHTEAMGVETCGLYPSLSLGTTCYGRRRITIIEGLIFPAKYPFSIHCAYHFFSIACGS
jgi:hypothetical protein